MAWTPQRLPITLPPIPGESLDSWLEAYARRLRAGSRDLLTHLGLTGSTPEHMVTMLTEPERRALSAATGLSPHTLTAMTLQPFHGIAVSIDPARRSVTHPPAWRRQTGSRFCPACLGERAGRWLLTWRLPWAFTCPVHTRLLADLCPACGKRPGPHRPANRTLPTVAGRCTGGLPKTAGQWRVQICGHPLAAVPTRALTAGGPVVAAQRRIAHLLTAAASTTDPGRRHRICRTLGELHALAYKGLDALHTVGVDAPSAVRDVLDECGESLPPPRGPLDSYDAHTIAVATTIAVTAHRLDPTSEQVLSWIITADRRRRASAEPGRILSPWSNASHALTARLLTALDPHLQPHDRLVYASASTHPRRPDATDEQIRRRAASLPALLWPAWAIRMIPASRGADNVTTGTRAGLAVMTLIPGTRLTTAQAVDLLAAPTSVAAASHTLSLLPEPTRSACIAILTDLAHALDTEPAPIDYTRRRALFHQRRVDRRAYTKLATAHGWRPPSPLQLRILDDHLAVLLTGTHPGHYTPLARWSTTDAFNPLAVALPSPVREFVHDQAWRLLARHHIDEPVTWHPPAPAAAPWPGIDPDTIDADQFANAFAAHATARGGLRRICQTTGLTNVQVRLYSQITHLVMPDQQWNTLAGISSHDVLDPVGLQHLYHDQQLSMMDIARLSLTTERVVRRTLTNAGTTLLSKRQRSTPVPLEWFLRHFVNTGKTVQQAAVEAGVSRNTFAKYAKLHNIPTGPHAPPVNPFAAWPAHQQPPPDVMAACSGPRGIEYVRQVLQIPGHQTRSAAAAALGLHEQVLCRHRQHVERAAGVHIFQPDLPLTPTPEGAQFLRQAAKALRRLDQINSGRS